MYADYVTKKQLHINIVMHMYKKAKQSVYSVNSIQFIPQIRNIKIKVYKETVNFNYIYKSYMQGFPWRLRKPVKLDRPLHKYKIL